MRPPEFWSRPGLLSGLLSPLGCLYDGLGRARRALASPYHAAVPIICVGNLVLGGAGKTPVAIDLGQRLAARGRSVHFLTRGYGGSMSGPLRVDPAMHTAADVGDEALLLARHAPTWMSADRPAGAKAAQDAGADVIVMDDGFQNPSLDKTLSLIVVDAGYGFGNEKVFPAGPLRESVVHGLLRADAVAVIGTGDIDTPPLPQLKATITTGADGDALKDQRVFAFAGIGRPEKFFDTVRALGADVAATHAFDDHYAYTDGDVAVLIARAQELNAIPLTTEKDLVRLPTAARDAVRVLPITLTWQDDAAVDALLDTALERQP